MEYKDLDILRSGYTGIHDQLIPAMLKTNEKQLRFRMNPLINPIIWMVWHILRTQDMFLSNVIFRSEQLFHSGSWQYKLGIDTQHVGTGMTAKEADQLAATVQLDALHAYNKAVKEHSLNLLSELTHLESDKLDPEEVIADRLRVARAFPEEVLTERARAYAPTPVSTCILGVISHAYMHFGQFLALMKRL